jgi:molecular chaperone DnaJ
MAKRDYYEVLGVAKDADDDTIKKAYRDLAKRHHPDRNSGCKEAEEKFKEAAEAFEVLRDPDKRRRYDRYGHAGVEGQLGPQFASTDSLREFFNSIFGMFGGEQGSVEDLEVEVQTDLSTAGQGLQGQKITVRRSELCLTCSGSGARAGTRPIRCPRCRGHGVLLDRRGFFSMQVECDQCRGRGEVVKDRCPDCHDGRVETDHELEIEVPRGISDSMTMRVRGKGHAGPPGQPRGDVVVAFRVAPHPLFQREGPHLVCRVPISFSQAALGGPIEVPTLTGSFTYDLPRGTQTGTVERFAGRGIYDYRARGIGDLIVQFVVETPRELSPRQEELLRELDELEHERPSAERKGFFQKLRDFFRPETKDGQTK